MIKKLIFLCAVTCSQSIQIHHHMTDDEVQRIFRVARHAVPEYEVVPVMHTLHRRDANEEQVVKLRAFDRNITLYLKPTEGILYGLDTPVITVFPNESAPHGMQYSRVPNAFNGIGKAYQDERSKSAIIVDKVVNETVQIIGTFYDYFIQPLPKKFKNLFGGKKSVNGTDDSSMDTDHHIIVKQTDPSINEIEQAIEAVELEDFGQINTTIDTTPVIPEVIYPEVLVFMDYSSYKAQDEALNKSLLYLLGFWNAVDLRFRTLTEPKVRLNIAAFVISIKDGGTPFLEDNIQESSKVDADAALKQMTKYFYQEQLLPFSKYDLVVAMTHLNMCRFGGESVCDDSAGGLAYRAGACDRNLDGERTLAVGIVQDNGGYDGIIPAAHEVGHLLGMRHDGQKATSNCPGSRGFIMTDTLTMGENNFYWSKCSIENFREFIKSPDSECLYNLPRKNSQLMTELPGKILSLNDQCKKYYGRGACKHDESVCTKLLCYHRTRDICIAQGAAAEGSECGPRKHCLNGRCLSMNATELAEPPDFTEE